MTEECKTDSSQSNDSSLGSDRPGQSSAMSMDLAALESQLSEAQSKANTYLDLAQRTQADFVNYKRRIEQERSDYARSARADIILKALGPLDDLDRAVESLPSQLTEADWAQGFALIDRKFHTALESLGVRPIDAVGKPFDPYQEESVAHEQSAVYPEGTVTRVIRPGYLLDGKIIRPAQVVISSGPANEDGQ